MVTFKTFKTCQLGLNENTLCICPLESEHNYTDKTPEKYTFYGYNACKKKAINI